MKLEKNNFYVFSVLEDDELFGYNGYGERVSPKNVNVIFYHNADDMETTLDCRICTQLEKEYWLDCMNIIDEQIPNVDYSAVSLCDFEDWKKEKGYID